MRIYQWCARERPAAATDVIALPKAKRVAAAPTFGGAGGCARTSSSMISLKIYIESGLKQIAFLVRGMRR
jgi:hypothetical protein